jgi:hypothetical protein
MAITGGCAGRTFEGEALRIVSSGNYKHVHNHVFNGLLGKVEDLENQSSQVTIRANSQSSGLQRQLQIREERIELGRNLLNNSQSLITGLQN